MGGFSVIAVVALLAFVAGDVTKIHFEMHERKENQTAVSIEEGDTLVVTFFCILTTGYAWKLGNSASPTPSAYRTRTGTVFFARITHRTTHRLKQRITANGGIGLGKVVVPGSEELGALKLIGQDRQEMPPDNYVFNFTAVDEG